jgi:hypothetical protein
MIRRYLERRRTELSRWWHAPTTLKDRTRGATIGAFAAFWIGALGRVAVANASVSVAEVAAWGLAGAILGVVIGAVFPKSVTCVLFPIASFGPSP